MRQDPVTKLVFELSKLPGIGEKTATRLAYHILKQGSDYGRALADAVVNAQARISLCSVCTTFTDGDTCAICSDLTRDHSLICVVEKPSDVNSIEQAHSFKGVYHVLHGVLSPLDGIGPEELKIRELLHRVQVNPSGVTEVLFATNPSVEGEATTLYLNKLLKPFGIKASRLASGIPIGGRLEFTDKQTISKAIENRMVLA